MSSIADGREKSMDELLNATTSAFGDSINFSATLDYAIPDTYWNTLVKGLAQDFPVLTGNAKDENGASYCLNVSATEYLSDFNLTYSSPWDQRFLSLYPANGSTTASGAYNSMFINRSKVGTYFWSRLWATVRSAPVSNYFWDHAPLGQSSGAAHESEINHVLNNLYATDKPWTDDDYTIAREMNGYWANFIKTGNPNGDGLVEWPAVNSSELVQHVGNGWGQVPVASKQKVKLFESSFDALEKH